MSQSLMVVVPSASNLARSSYLTLRQLRERSWLLPSYERVPEFRKEIDGLFRDAGYQPNVALEVDDEVAAGALIAAGMGVGLLPGLASPVRHPHVTYVALRPKRVRTLHAVTTTGPHTDAVVTLLSELELAASRIPAANIRT